MWTDSLSIRTVQVSQPPPSTTGLCSEWTVRAWDPQWGWEWLWNMAVMWDYHVPASKVTHKPMCVCLYFDFCPSMIWTCQEYLAFCPMSLKESKAICSYKRPYSMYRVLAGIHQKTLLSRKHLRSFVMTNLIGLVRIYHYCHWVECLCSALCYIEGVVNKTTAFRDSCFLCWVWQWKTKVSPVFVKQSWVCYLWLKEGSCPPSQKQKKQKTKTNL